MCLFDSGTIDLANLEREEAGWGGGASHLPRPKVGMPGPGKLFPLADCEQRQRRAGTVPCGCYYSLQQRRRHPTPFLPGGMHSKGAFGFGTMRVGLEPTQFSGLE